MPLGADLERLAAGYATHLAQFLASVSHHYHLCQRPNQSGTPEYSCLDGAAPRTPDGCSVGTPRAPLRAREARCARLGCC